MPYIKQRILIKCPTLSSERQKLRHIFWKSPLKVLFDNLLSNICLPLSLTRILERLDRSGSSEWNYMSFSSPPDASHHIRRGLPQVPSFRAVLLIDHRLQETAASTFRLRVIIRSQQPVARGVSIVAIEVWCYESAVRLLEKEADSGTRFALK